MNNSTKSNTDLAERSFAPSVFPEKVYPAIK